MSVFVVPYRSEGSPGLQIVSAYSSDIVDDFRNKPCMKIRSELGVPVVYILKSGFSGRFPIVIYKGKSDQNHEIS